MSKFGLENIKILKVNVFFDENTKTCVNETDNLMQYESQHFKCKVDLNILPGETDKCWSIGLVQACDHMLLENRYGEIGSSFWEFHPLKSGKHSMVNDSDGLQYPFYSTTTSKMEIRKGNVEESFQSLHYEDHFYPSVAWELPYCNGAKLTDVIRRQDFWIWLIAIHRGSQKIETFNYFNPRFDQVFVLRTMRWRYNLHMMFDKDKPPGQKLINILDKQENFPYVLNSSKPLPLSALSPPDCNAAQSLIWYPKDLSEKLKVLVPPKQIITPWEIWQADMAKDKKLKVQKPNYCKFVGQWPPQTPNNY